MSRIRREVGLGVEMGLSLEWWERPRLWKLTRAQADYPISVKRKLGQQAPPALYGCGNKDLLRYPGLAVRSLGPGGAQRWLPARVLFCQARQNGLSIVADDAPEAMRCVTGAISNHGLRGFIICGHGILKPALVSDFRVLLISNKLLLLSTSDPEAPRRHHSRSTVRVHSLSVAAIAVDQSFDHSRVKQRLRLPGMLCRLQRSA